MNMLIVRIACKSVLVPLIGWECFENVTGRTSLAGRKRRIFASEDPLESPAKCRFRWSRRIVEIKSRWQATSVWPLTTDIERCFLNVVLSGPVSKYPHISGRSIQEKRQHCCR